MSLDLLVPYAPCGGGHRAAALAVVEAARARGLTAEALDVFEGAPRVVTDPYLRFHFTVQSLWPGVYGAGYHRTNARGGPMEPLRLRFDAWAFCVLRRRVAAHAPRAVVATHHLPLVVLGRERRKGRLGVPLVGVVTDYAAHACWAERFVDRFCVPGEYARRELVAHGVPPERVALTGIPVRAAFEGAAPLRAPRAGEPLRVLVTSGGFGVGPVLRVVRSFAGVPGVELTVVCGAAPSLVSRVREEAARLGMPARVLGFERDMPARVADAHVVVGKAGGLTVSEVLTAGRPLVVVGAIPGNERFNEAFVVGGGAGARAAPDAAGRVVHGLRAPSVLEAMGARARLLTERRAADRVVDEALRLVGPRPYHLDAA
jgi:processive 1,2-diacylglycerol beta-glucosyltransferase